MKITIVHNEVGNSNSTADLDVLHQVEAVRTALQKLGHQPATNVCGNDPGALLNQLSTEGTDLVFNLVESFQGLDRNLHLFPMMLGNLGIRYTGASARTLLATNHKTQAKSQMLDLALPTPAWLGPLSIDPIADDLTEPVIHGELLHLNRWILKSLWEHASQGMDQDSVIRESDPQIILAVLRERLSLLGGAGFAEAYIPGREFNISVLAGPNGPEVLPPAEILFHGFNDAEAKIVDYRAKWDEDSREYLDTPRSFTFPGADKPLLDRLKQLTLRCWEDFSLRGWARVDFRVDETGQPWILEINANPCLSPDAGFAAALEQAGIPYPEAIRRIIHDAG